jgi:predicted aspartyl protease
MPDRRYRIEVASNGARLKSVGPLVPGAWRRQSDELGREIRGEFLIDTGAYGAMIDLEIAEALQLTLHGTREVHGIHGYGHLQQYLGRVSLPAFDADGRRTVYSAVIECVGVPSLREKNREHGADIIGILGRMFLVNARLAINGATGKIELEIHDLSGNDPQ